MKETTNGHETFTCHNCGKVRNLEQGVFLDEEQKKFCCENCCTDGKVSKASGDDKKPLVCEFC
jgi:hypothetical protein